MMRKISIFIILVWLLLPSCRSTRKLVEEISVDSTTVNTQIIDSSFTISSSTYDFQIAFRADSIVIEELFSSDGNETSKKKTKYFGVCTNVKENEVNDSVGMQLSYEVIDSTKFAINKKSKEKNKQNKSFNWQAIMIILVLISMAVAIKKWMDKY